MAADTTPRWAFVDNKLLFTALEGDEKSFQIIIDGHTVDVQPVFTDGADGVKGLRFRFVLPPINEGTFAWAVHEAARYYFHERHTRLAAESSAARQEQGHMSEITHLEDIVARFHSANNRMEALVATVAAERQAEREVRETQFKQLLDGIETHRMTQERQVS